MVFFRNEVAIGLPSRPQRSASPRRRADPRAARVTGSPHPALARRAPPVAAQRPVAEEGPAHPHHGRALGHRLLQVVGHPHRPLGQAEPVGQLADRAGRPAGRRGGVDRGHGHQPARPRGRRSPRSRTRAGASVGGAAVAPRSARTSSTSTRTVAPGAPPGDLGALGQPGHRLPAGDERGEGCGPCCAGRRRGSATAARRAPGGARPPPWPPAPGRSSRPRRTGRRPAPPPPPRAPNPLVTATTRTAPGSPPGRLDRADGRRWPAPPRRRRSSGAWPRSAVLAEERRDVEVVVPEVELVVGGVGEDVDRLTAARARGRGSRPRRTEPTPRRPGGRPPPSARTRPRSPSPAPRRPCCRRSPRRR